MESWLNIVNCIVNRTILFAPRQITISHYRILVDHKSLIPSPPVIIKFICNLIKSMYWIITLALIVSGLKTCFLQKLGSSLELRCCLCPSKERWELWMWMVRFPSVTLWVALDDWWTSYSYPVLFLRSSVFVLEPVVQCVRPVCIFRLFRGN